MKTVIVEDSPLQRLSLSRLVERHPALVLEGHFKNASETLAFIQKHSVELILVDVELPVINGFELLKSLSDQIVTIIVSSKEEYALKAFDHEVTDYLLKPVDFERFDKAVKKAIKKREGIAYLHRSDHIFVKSNLRIVKVALDEIKWVEALGDYVKVVLDHSNLMVLSTMSDFLKKLPEKQFVRIHKSYIINLERIDDHSNNSITIEQKNFPISRKRKREILDQIKSRE